MPRGMKKGLDTQKFNRYISKVKSSSGRKANPYAVCNSTMGGKVKEGVKIPETLEERNRMILMYSQLWWHA
jgi:hypothetical protein